MIESSTDAYELFMKEKFRRLDACAEKAAWVVKHEKDKALLIEHHEATMNTFYEKIRKLESYRDASRLSLNEDS